MNNYLRLSTQIFTLIIVTILLIACDSKKDPEPVTISGKWINTLHVYETWIDGTKSSTEAVPIDDDNTIRIVFNQDGTFDQEFLNSGALDERSGKYTVVNDTLTVEFEPNSFTQKFRVDFVGASEMILSEQRKRVIKEGKEIVEKEVLNFSRE